MLALPTSLAIAAQLLAADVSVVVAVDSAIVVARFRVADTVEAFGASVIRLANQDVDFLAGDNVERRTPGEAGYGLWWVQARPVERTPGLFELRYVVSGNFERIPIPVPELPAAPGATAVTLRITGVVENLSERDAFPRLMHEADGSLVAHLDNVPSFVRLPRASRRWSINRLTEVLVLVLVVLATAGWLVRVRVRRSVG